MSGAVQIIGRSLQVPTNVDDSQGVRRYALANEEIFSPADRRAYRSMCRATLLAARAVKDAWDSCVPPVAAPGNRIGIYLAVDDGPVSAALLRGLAGLSDEEAARKFKSICPPKESLAKLPPLKVAHLTIILGTTGPSYAFNHSEFGCAHSLRKAGLDLEMDFVDCAVVCSSYAAHEEVLNHSYRFKSSGSLSEGAAALVLINAARVEPSPALLMPDNDFEYGIATPLVRLLQSPAFQSNDFWRTE